MTVMADDGTIVCATHTATHCHTLQLTLQHTLQHTSLCVSMCVSLLSSSLPLGLLDLTLIPLLAPWIHRPPAMETPPRLVPAGPLISCHDPRTLHVIEPHLERAVPLSRRDGEWRHVVVPTPLLHWGAPQCWGLVVCCSVCCSVLQCVAVCVLQTIYHLCSNLFQPRAIMISIDPCWSTNTRSLHLCVSFWPPPLLSLLFW